jgi:N-acetylmuramoyl-L-alanine amidase
VRRLELHPTDRGLELQIEASAPVRVTSVRLAHPSRLAIDITPAWFQIEAAPQPAGVIRSVRLGQFTKETARVVMELSQDQVRVSGLPQSATVITARLQPGAEVARAPEPEAPSSAPDAQPQPAMPQPPSAPAALPSRLRGHRLLVRRGLASRGGFVRRDSSLIGESPDGGILAGKVICIDAGHGGWKSGAEGLNGLKEGDACLAMAKQLERALRESGATVIMPREDDSYVSLEDRYTFANLKHADLFISIHCNAMPKHNTMSGTETYYWSPQSLDLARALHPQVVAAMGGRDGGIRRRAFAVIHHSTMPSILIEVGYIDNVNDEAKLGDPAFQESFGNAVRDGVLHYFGG